MKYIFVLVALLTFSSTFAQKKTTATSTVNVTEAIRQYHFTEAVNQLNQQVTQLRKKKLDTTAAEARLRAVQRAKSKLSVTEQITFIDSLVFLKSDIFKHLYFGSENGAVVSYAQQFSTTDSLEASVFISPMGDNMLYAKPDSKGHLMLYSSQKLGKEWSPAVSLNEQGLDTHGDTDQNFPFVLSDGTTLYYAAQGEESIGGYDIFMTRYDADEHHYLAPENIGMPFNSPANDYLFAIDEYDNLGWLLTDRNQHDGNVCLYTFIPNTTRQIYDEAAIGEARLCSYAMIRSIADTQQDKEAVAQAQQRLATLKQESASAPKAGNASTNNGSQSSTSGFQFPISSSVTYTSLDQFRNAKARKQAEFLIESKSDLQQSETKLQQLRDKYASANASTKQQLKAQILPLEQHVEKLNKEIKQQEKNIRQIELQK